MLKIGNFVSVYSDHSYKAFIAKIIGLDYDKGVVFVISDDSNTFEVPFSFVDSI